jgi:hypothetical protein
MKWSLDFLRFAARTGWSSLSPFSISLCRCQMYFFFYSGLSKIAEHSDAIT